MATNFGYSTSNSLCNIVIKNVILLGLRCLSRECVRKIDMVKDSIRHVQTLPPARNAKHSGLSSNHRVINTELQRLQFLRQQDNCATFVV
jgi:hypothetical protein